MPEHQASIEGLAHVALSVASLERSLTFYRDVLGLQLVARARLAGECYESILGIPDVAGAVAMLQAGRMQLELFEFASPAPAPPQRAVCDHGIMHFAMEVADVDAEYRRLRAQGVRFLSAPVRFAGGAKAVYGRDPDDNVFELLQVASR